ncbi:hypothetical protein HT136_01850, partial [Novosphingobium profundi]|uniref:hypothetical protein n=1 Tax=Novosphingobium profundi TaxID=1774954 RepID=UPI001BDB1F43
MEGTALLTLGLALFAAGPVLLRLGWRGPRVWVALGWTALVLGCALVLPSDGAWGLAVGCTLASTGALALLALAGWRSPAPGGTRAERVPAP